MDAREVVIDSEIGPSSLLSIACQDGDLEIVAYLVEQGLDALAYDPSGHTPHHIAASNGQVAALEWLFDHFAIPVDAATMDLTSGMTALHLAFTAGMMSGGVSDRSRRRSTDRSGIL